MSYSQTRPASDKQVQFIHDLLDQKDLVKSPTFLDSMGSSGLGPFIRRIKDQVGDPTDARKPRIGSRRASEIIDKLKDLPYKRFNSSVERCPAVNSEVGMYIVEQGQGPADPRKGGVLRVYLGQQSGRNLVKRLVDTGQPHPDDPDIHLRDWEYVGGATGHKAQAWLRNARRMTLAEAKEYGRMTGSCCRCGRRLDVPESVEAGIGPVCAGKVEEWA